MNCLKWLQTVGKKKYAGCLPTLCVLQMESSGSEGSWVYWSAFVDSRLLSWEWISSTQKTGVGCHFLLQGIVSLISLSDLLLLVCRNAADFYLLVLHPAALLNSLVRSGSFLVVSLGGDGVFYMYSKVSATKLKRHFMSSVTSDSFACSFPIWIPFIYFFLV